MRPSITRTGALAGVLATGGCSMFFGPGYADLPDAKTITQLEIGLAGGGRDFCANDARTQLRAGVRYDDQPALVTWTYDKAGKPQTHDKLDFAAFDWRASVGTIDADGRFQLGDPVASLGTPVEIEARVRGRPDLVRRVTLAPSFRCQVIRRVGGGYGIAGKRGYDGSMRAFHDGNPGHVGLPGDDAAPVVVALDYVPGTVPPLVRARITTAGASRDVVFDPTGPKPIVDARGGHGGDGGPGGHGWFPGHDGAQGDGADGGDGAIVTVSTGGHPELAGLVVIDVRGGAGGRGTHDGRHGRDGAIVTQ